METLAEKTLLGHFEVIIAAAKAHSLEDDYITVKPLAETSPAEEDA